jgi:hypothetical protein
MVISLNSLVYTVDSSKPKGEKKEKKVKAQKIKICIGFFWFLALLNKTYWTDCYCEL